MVLARSATGQVLAMQGEDKLQAGALSSGSMPVPGDLVADKYRIEAVLGRGGMSVVYRATHLALDQQVAIKILSAEALLLPEYVVRIKREARAVSRIRSEHVVRVHDIGELPGSGVPYLVMECLEGLDLAAVLAKRGPFPVELAIECVMQTCEALAEAHAIGIIHRDLKPANLFLSEAVDGSPCVKVLDFGISRMASRHGLSALTDPGTVLGTPSYMAPEQMEGSDDVDARSDIWALGAIFYELLVGKPPYKGDSLPQIFVKVMRSRPPKASSLRAGVRSAVDTIIAQCLEPNPEDRFQTVAELGWALSAVGAARSRDSAARIARVLERRSTDETPSGTHRSSLPPPVVHVVRRWSRQLRRLVANIGTGIASIALVSAASVFGVLALREATDRPAPETRPVEVPSSPASPEGEIAVALLPVPTPRDASDAGAPQPEERGARRDTGKVEDPAQPVRE